MLRKIDKHYSCKMLTKKTDTKIIVGFDGIAKAIMNDIQTKIEQHKGIKIDSFYNWDVSVKSLSLGLINAFGHNALTYKDYEKFSEIDKLNLQTAISKHLIKKYSFDDLLITMRYQNTVNHNFLLYVSDSNVKRSNQSSVQGIMILSRDLKDAIYSFLIFKNSNKQMFTFFQGCGDKKSILNQALPVELQSLIASKLLASCIQEHSDNIQSIKTWGGLK